MKKVTITRKEHFNAAHRLYRPDWSDVKNNEVFGKCNNPNYHGHNYELLVQLTGPIDPETGFVYDMSKLSKLIQKHIVQAFDHKNLNLDVPQFKNLNPTAENIAVVIWDILRAELPTKFDLKIILYETKRNIAEYAGT